MKKIWIIMKNELKLLFCSPIAWLLLVILFVQTGISYSGALLAIIRSKILAYGMENMSGVLFSNEWTGVLVSLQSYLYLYVPLLTMGLISRDRQNGTSRLLESSPITPVHIVFGKFCAMAVFGLAFLSEAFIFAAISWPLVENFDILAVCAGILGIYLLYLAYSAIGLFMSSLTSYPIVAAVGTLATLFAMNLIPRFGQDIPIMRDIAYWIGISGRADSFIAGMICSEDVIYYVGITLFFLVLCIFKLDSFRTRPGLGKSLLRYGSAVLVLFAVAFVSSRPALKVYADATQVKSNTLTVQSQEVVSQLDGPLEITTYVNLLGNDAYYGYPRNYLSDVSRFSRYSRFKPDISFKYVYYYHDSPDGRIASRPKYRGMTTDEIARSVMKTERLREKIFIDSTALSVLDSELNLASEGYNFFRVLRYNGKEARLRMYDDMDKHPAETEITAAMKTLLNGAEKVGILSGHGERAIDATGEKGLYTMAAEKTFRYSLINQGFEVTPASCDKLDDFDIIVIADPRENFDEAEAEALRAYVQGGGSLLVAAKKYSREVLAPLSSMLGVSFSAEPLAGSYPELDPDLCVAEFTHDACSLTPMIHGYKHEGYVVCGNGTLSLDCGEAPSKGFTVTELLRAPEGCVACALSRKVGSAEQRIIVLGNADFITNGEMRTTHTGVNSANYGLVMESMRYLSGGEFPVYMYRQPPIDNHMRLLDRAWKKPVKYIFRLILPLLLLLAGAIFLIRRRSR